MVHPLSDSGVNISQTAQAVAWDAVAPEQVAAGVTRQVVNGDRQTLVRYVYRPGAVFARHHHPQEQITVVLSGQIEFTIGDQVVTLGPGELVVIPGDVPHGARVLGGEVVESINALSPRRSEHPAPAGS